MIKVKDFFKKQKNVIVWSLFDFANTSFSITVVTFVFAVYFKDIIAQNLSIGDLYWSLATGISMLIVAIIAPVLGAIADFSYNKKRYLLFFTILCLVATSMLYFMQEGMVFLSVILFIFANIGFEAGLVFYDSFLPEITEEKNYGRVSGYGYAMGYFGSLVSLLILIVFLSNNIKLSFPISALFFLIFSLPLFLFLKEQKGIIDKKVSYISVGLGRLKYTLTHLKNYKNLTNFLISFFLYIEGVNTAIYFSGIYALTTLKFSINELTIFFIVTQFFAIAGSIFFGIVSDHIGHKKTIYITLFLWLIAIILAGFTVSKEIFYVVGILAGTGMGSTQSVSRSLLSKLIPIEKKTEFFGFYSFFGKSSAILGPLVFGLVSWLTNSQRYAIFSVLIFFVIGMILLKRVKEV